MLQPQQKHTKEQLCHYLTHCRLLRSDIPSAMLWEAYELQPSSYLPPISQDVVRLSLDNQHLAGLNAASLHSFSLFPEISARLLRLLLR